MSKPVCSTGAVIAEHVIVRFSDGEHAVPPHAVVEAGGRQALEEAAADLATVTFEQFMRATAEEMSSRFLNNIQSKIVSDHLRGVGRRW